MALSKPTNNEMGLQLAHCGPRLEEVMDLVVIILSYLPVQSAVRFMVVCKSWNAVIRSKNFIEMHLSRSRDALHIASRFSVIRPTADHLLSAGYIIASWNGLVCQRTMGWALEKFSVRNLVTSQTFDIPEDYGCPFSRDYFFGVGYGPRCYDYKFYKFLKSPPPKGGHECRMYSSITGTWKSIGPAPACPLYNLHVCVDETVYWQIYKGREDFPGSILAVDEFDNFRTFDPPELGSGWWPYLVSLGNSLGLVVIYKEFYDFSRMSVWVLESPLPIWTKKLETIIPLLYFELAVSAAAWGNIVLITTPNRYLFYCMDTGMWSGIGAGWNKNNRSNFSGFFTESLVPCNGEIEA